MKIITTLFLIAAAHECVAQGCIADAGPDRTVCGFTNPATTLHVGGSPAASGTAPFTYLWSCTFTLAMGQNVLTLTASDFLSDTAVANPALLSPGYATLVPLVLTVTDSVSNECTDTVWVTYSNAVTHLGQYTYTINPGDTLQFTGGPNLGGGIQPVTYKWRPNHGLIDSTNSNFSTAPQQSTSYYVVMTDAAGCVFTGSPFVFVNIGAVSVSEILRTNIEVKIAPNPAVGMLRMQISGSGKEDLELFITDLNGKVVHVSEVQGQEVETDISGLDSGVYFVSLKAGEREVWRGRMIAQ